MARGIELATAYVSLAVSTDDIAKTIAGQFGNVERKVAPQAGKKIGQAMARGFEAEKPDLDRLEREFEDAQKRIVQAEQRATTEQENLARKVEIAQKKKEEAVKKYGEESSQALVAVDRLVIAEQKLESATMRAEDERRKLNSALEDAEEKFKKARQESEKLDDSTGELGESAKTAGAKWDSLKDSISKAISGDYKGAFKSLVDSAKGSSSEVVDTFEGIGDAAGDKFNNKFTGVLKTLGPLVAAAGIGKIVSDAITAGIEEEKAADKIQAALGLTEADAREAQDMARRVYGEGWGGTAAEASSAVEHMLSANPRLKVDSSELELATSQALALSEVFGTDIAMTAQVAGQMVEKGLAGSTLDALDLLAAGMQTVPATMRDEFIDAVEEYGPHLANLGYTGEKAFSVLASASDKGKYGIDKAGDAMKEFSIRATDGSSASREAYEAIGLDADEMANKILAGGETAKEATDQIVEGLLGIEDPGERAQAAIALFGTPLEDLAVSDIPVFLSGLTDTGNALGNVKDRADTVAETMSGNFATKLEVGKRAVQNFMAEVGERLIEALGVAYEWISDKLGPVFDWLAREILPPVISVFTEIKNVLVEQIFPIFERLWDWVKVILGPAMEALGRIVSTVWQAIWGVISWAWELISGVFEVLKNVLYFDLTEAWISLQTTVSDAWNGIWGAIKSVWDNYLFPFFRGLGQIFTDYISDPFWTAVNAMRTAWEGVKNWFAAPINWVIDHVINGGVISFINVITGALGLDSLHIPNVSRIASPTAATGGGGGGGGGRGGGGSVRFGAYAKGGYAKPGWALVGEEGPELVNFTRPGRVYTAEETANALGMTGRDFTSSEANLAMSALSSGNSELLRKAAGSSPEEALLPMGGWGRFTDWISDKWDGITEWTANIAGKAVSFVRGKLADAARAVISPLQSAIRSNISGIFADFFVGAGDKLINWIAGVDRNTKDIVTVEDAFSGIFPGLPGGTIGDSLMSAGARAGGTVRPLRGGQFTSGFGMRWGRMHQGIDLAAPTGTPIYAYKGGVVTRATFDGVGGNNVMIAHPGGLSSYYAHMSKILTSRGAQVRAGQMIGRVGSTGRSTGPHLHWGIKRGGAWVNPAPYLPGAKYDKGGFLEPGLTLVENRTNKPEPVFTADQWQLIEQSVTNGVNRDVRVLEVRDVNNVLLGSMAVQAERALDREGAWR